MSISKSPKDLLDQCMAPQGESHLDLIAISVPLHRLLVEFDSKDFEPVDFVAWTLNSVYFSVGGKRVTRVRRNPDLSRDVSYLVQNLDV